MSLDWSKAWEVLVLYLIPIGGGIPAGVVLAHKYKIGWHIMMALYFVSDVILACIFEPVIHLAKELGRRSEKVARFNEAFRKSFAATTSKYGVSLGPLQLILVSFGVDPMTGRTAAFAAGHGFISGWFLAICGDMIFFTILMASTLWLNNVLGDGTWTTIIIVVAMIVVPKIFRRVKEWWTGTKAPALSETTVRDP